MSQSLMTLFLTTKALQGSIDCTVVCSVSQDTCWQAARSASKFSFLLVQAVVSLTRRLLSLSAASASSLISPPLCSSFSLCNRCNQLAPLQCCSSFTILFDRTGFKVSAMPNTGFRCLPWQYVPFYMLASCHQLSKALSCSWQHCIQQNNFMHDSLSGAMLRTPSSQSGCISM